MVLVWETGLKRLWRKTCTKKEMSPLTLILTNDNGLTFILRFFYFAKLCGM